MSLSIYIKPTNFCTIDCDHCYLTEDVRANKTIMTDETLFNTGRLAVDLAKREGHEQIHIIWHGGEPMMLDPEWYQNAILILNEAIGKGKYTQSIQTSLIPYRSKWKSLIDSNFEGFIGSSIDFTQRKVGSSTEGYIDLWLKKVSMAKSDGFTVIPMMVPSRMELGKGKEIVEWFEQHDFPAFSIERYSDVGGTNLYAPKNIHHSDFMVEVFDAVLERLLNNQRVSYINVIAAAINGVEFEMPGDRWGGSCQREFVVVEPDGSLNSCPDRTSYEPSFSNANDGAVKFMTSEPRRNWIRVQNITHKKDHCHGCEFNTWCKSGCPIANNVLSDKELECSGYRRFLHHVKKHLADPRYKNILIEYAKPLGAPIEAENLLRG